MDYITEIQNYPPVNDQEAADKEVILQYIKQFPESILLRENAFAHFSSSGFILNKEFTKTLMIHHNIRNTWAWTGGHTDGDSDLLHVALKEAKEETGLLHPVPLSTQIAGLDILPVYGHYKNGHFVSGHQHLSVAYLLIADENESLFIKEEENSGVCWFPLTEIRSPNFAEEDVVLYQKLIQKAQKIRTT